jgi:hypothetical protein
MSKLNGLDGIVHNDDKSIEQVIQRVLFFDKNIVQRQASAILQQIEEKKAIPVRYNSNQHFYRQNEERTSSPSFKNKKEALRYVKNPQSKPLFHKETDIKICFDSDGNYTTKKDIAKYTNHHLAGENRSIIHYNISHIWGKTDNPLFFSLMWNYCLIPSPYAFLTDRNDVVSSRIRYLIRAISVKLYNPDQFLSHWNVSVEMPSQQSLDEAERLIKGEKICYIKQNKQNE